MQSHDGAGMSTREGLTTVSNWVGFIIRTFAVTVEVFLRTGFGARHLGLQAAAALPLMFVFTTFWPEHDARPMAAFFIAYLAACLRARIGVLRAQRRGETIHSRYGGRPRIARWFPRLDERTVKGRIEPALVLVIGIVTMPFNEPMGAYLVIASLALAGSVGSMVAYERAQALQTLDSMIEAREHAERVRAMSGHRW